MIQNQHISGFGENYAHVVRITHQNAPKSYFVNVFGKNELVLHSRDRSVQDYTENDAKNLVEKHTQDATKAAPIRFV